ncbi:hypothetical protein K3495_g14189 [Podosphaera aphanis]|nr:hypothetical protein K3495_g14189 [Podosphaera aphanis]
MSNSDAPSTSIVARAAATKKAMAEVRKCHASRKVADAMNTRNGPITKHIHKLPLGSEVIVSREGKGWDKTPYKLVWMDGETVQIDMNGRYVNFRSTRVKPFLRESQPFENQTRADPVTIQQENREILSDEPILQQAPQKLRRSKRQSQPRNLGLEPRATITTNRNFITSFVDVIIEGRDFIEVEALLSEKETRDREISLDLRKKGIIKTTENPFVSSRRKEMEGLLAQGVYELIQRDADELHNSRIFGSRMVDEVKGKETAIPYEKSRLVIQAYMMIMRIIVALAPSPFSCGISLFTRDITQAYVQLRRRLTRPIYATPPKEMCHEFSSQNILKILKPLYGIPESGTHWFRTYHEHHKTKLGMKNSTYDPCLLITKEQDGPIGILGMQTDDTLLLGDEEFVRKEAAELHKEKLLAKPTQKLKFDNPLLFNGYTISIAKDGYIVNLTQKGHGKLLREIDPNAEDFKRDFIRQRARGAYIASICQPKAAFDCSVAAQHQNPGKEEIEALNRRLKWQKENLDRGLHYVPLELESVKMFVFVDGSFANNHDLSSQIGYVIALGNETLGDGDFKLKANILHWSSTKFKRVPRGILASELYGMVSGIDMGISISTTLNMIIQQLKIDSIPVVVCTDSFSLYECMVKLGTTKKKRLMIDIMAIRQSYERRELSEIRWITGDSNPSVL